MQEIIPREPSNRVEREERWYRESARLPIKSPENKTISQ
jgi:hypothetical protein